MQTQGSSNKLRQWVVGRDQFRDRGRTRRIRNAGGDRRRRRSTRGPAGTSNSEPKTIFYRIPKHILAGDVTGKGSSQLSCATSGPGIGTG